MDEFLQACGPLLGQPGGGAREVLQGAEGKVLQGLQLSLPGIKALQRLQVVGADADVIVAINQQRLVGGLWSLAFHQLYLLTQQL